MKSSKKVLALALALAMAVTAVPATTAEAATTGVPKTKTYYAGKSYTLTLTTPKTWKSVKTTWSEKNSAISLSSKKTKSVKVKAIKATKKATVKCKVTYKKSTKKGAKRYTKNYSTVITVKNPSLSVKAAATTLTVGETAKLTVKKTPSSATVKYSSSDDAVASVAKGVITANGVGTAIITTKLTCGTKTISKNITVNVTEALNDGVTATLTNAYSADYPDVVVTNEEINKDGKAIVRLYYGKNNKGVDNEYLTVKYTYDGGKSYSTRRLKTDTNGVTYWEPEVWDFVDFGNEVYAAKVSYTVTPESDSSLTKSGSFQIGTIKLQDVINVNGCDGKKTKATDTDTTDYKTAGYGDLKVSINDVKDGDKAQPITWSAGTYTKEVNGVLKTYPRYWTEFVNSQQVDNKVGFIGGTPYITLPGEDDALSSAQNFTQTVDKASGDYGTYASQSEYITLEVNPNELTYATMNFTSLKLSKYTKLVIEEYENEEKAKDGKADDLLTTPFVINGPHDQNNFSYQIPLSGKTKTLCIKLTLKSAGQVNTDTNKGYVVKDITGVYKNKSGKGGVTEKLKGAKITWSAATAKYSEEKPIKLSDIKSYLADDTLDGTDSAMKDKATNKDVSKLTYSVPVFPYTGNAVIKAYDKNGAVVAYFACPTVNKETVVSLGAINHISGSPYYGTDNWSVYANENDLLLDTYRTKFIYRISEEEATKSVGTVTSENDVVTVESTKAGTTVVKGEISGVPGLDATNNTVYTSVQWNPVKKAVDAHDCGIAFAGQEVKLTAQLVDKEQNPVATAKENIKFQYDNNNKKGNVSVLGETIKPTDSKGQAELTVVSPEEGSALPAITASNANYDVVLLVNGKQVKTLDLYWIEARSAFTPSVVENVPTAGCIEEMNQSKYPVITTSNGAILCNPTIGENWQYGFNTAKEKLADAGDWAKATVTINNAKVTVTNEAGTGATVKDAGNGSVYATSTAPQTITLSAIVDGSAYDNNGITFDVKKTDGSETKGIKGVGAGNTSFKNTQKLEIKWARDGQKGTFVDDLGYNAVTGTAIGGGAGTATKTVYFKVTDKLGNGIKNEDISVKVDNGYIVSGGAFNVTGGSIRVTSDSGIAVITVTQNERYDYKTVVGVTYDGVTYQKTVTWNNTTVAPALIVNTNAGIDASKEVTETNPRSTYADTNKVVLTFNDNILATSVKASMFKVTYGGKQIGVKSVEVSGKTITINYLNPITIDDYSKTFDVTVTPKTIDDVTYEITSVNGAVYNAATTELIGISANRF